MRMKTMMAHVRKIARAKKFSRYSKPMAAGVMALVVIIIVGAAMLMAARDNARQQQPLKIAATNKALIPPDGPAASPMAAAADGRPAVATLAPVTITGCLEQRDGAFQLKDTAGADAPKSRSWKSGFLKKHSASVDVVDAIHRLKLNDHVGQRVSVTGTLNDREMRARTVKLVASDCHLFK